MKVPRSININKAVNYAIVINALQILAVIALGAYVLLDGVGNSLKGLPGELAVCALAALVTWGAAVDIREALSARRLTVQLGGLDETVNQMTDLNHALRAQRHDFLNHLQVVYSLMEMKDFQEAQDYIEQVYGDIQSVSQTLRTQCAPVNALLRVKLRQCQDAGVTPVLTVTGAWTDLPLPAWEMCRVLSNLIDNALDAMAGMSGGSLQILIGENLQQFFFTVENNGPVIPADQCARIFEPGVSGKGDGRGMGLSIARQTLRGAGGDLTVKSLPGSTAFSGFVPRCAPGRIN